MEDCYVIIGTGSVPFCPNSSELTTISDLLSLMSFLE